MHRTSPAHQYRISPWRQLEQVRNSRVLSSADGLNVLPLRRPVEGGIPYDWTRLPQRESSPSVKHGVELQSIPYPSTKPASHSHSTRTFPHVLQTRCKRFQDDNHPTDAIARLAMVALHGSMDGCHSAFTLGGTPIWGSELRRAYMSWERPSPFYVRARRRGARTPSTSNQLTQTGQGRIESKRESHLVADDAEGTRLEDPTCK